MRPLVAACLTATAVLTGCSTGAATDPLQATDTLVTAQPARSPATTQPPQGTTAPAPAGEHTALDPATGTLAVTSGSTLHLFDTRALDRPPRTIQLPSTPATLRTDQGNLLAALPDSSSIATIDPRTSKLDQTPVAGAPVDAVHIGELLAVALRDGKVTFLRDGTPHSTATGFRYPAQLLPAGGKLLVLDRLTTSITPVDPRTGDKDPALRAGQGATHAVTDRHGRLLVTDTRVGEYLAFTAAPLIMKQRYPVPGVPYGIAYDPTRDLAWITLTGTNEVVGYDVAGGEPAERYRLPTVHQPNSVEVNPARGEVYITSATGAGIQVVRV